MFEQLEKTLAEMRSTLLNDSIIRQLITNSSDNCLTETAPSVKTTEKYITLNPIYQFENKEDYEQNGMINIVLNSSTATSEYQSIYGVIQVNVVYNIDKWQLSDNKIRVIELINRIVKLLDHKKFSISKPLLYTSTQPLVATKQLVGYALLFDYTDGSSELTKF